MSVIDLNVPTSSNKWPTKMNSSRPSTPKAQKEPSIRTGRSAVGLLHVTSRGLGFRGPLTSLALTWDLKSGKEPKVSRKSRSKSSRDIQSLQTLRSSRNKDGSISWELTRYCHRGRRRLYPVICHLPAGCRCSLPSRSTSGRTTSRSTSALSRTTHTRRSSRTASTTAGGLKAASACGEKNAP